MGILNITPDSFYDGGKYQDLSSISKRVEEMLSEGMHILDIGAYSSRPGAEHINEEEEFKRIEPILNALRSDFPDVIISVDTFRSEIARRVIEAGADIINDISGGIMDDQMIEVVANFNVPYVVMHMQGNPQSMQQNPQYQNVVQEVYQFFSSRLNACYKKGISDVILDPGFGFGKTLEHNYQLLKSLKEFKEFNCHILAGISRKSMINKVIQSKASESLNGTSVANTVALLEGATMLRVHDVKAAKEAIDIVSFMQNV